jgi:hypothetical protein
VSANVLGALSRLLCTYDEKNRNEDEAGCENEEDSPGGQLHQNVLVAISHDHFRAPLRKMCDSGCDHFDDDVLRRCIVVEMGGEEGFCSTATRAIRGGGGAVTLVRRWRRCSLPRDPAG